MLISCNGFLLGAILYENGKKLFTLDIHPLAPNIHPKTSRISIAIDLPRWKNVSVARSAPKTRRERGPYVFFAPVTEIIDTDNLHSKGKPFTNTYKCMRMKHYAL